MFYTTKTNNSLPPSRQRGVLGRFCSTGIVLGEQSFDAWGRERNYKDWTKDTITQPTGSPFASITSLYGYGNNSGFINRGFTGHEHLPQFNLINMNGRLYDPTICRMLSPDNYVQDPTSTQSYNRYSYVLNNPLKYTDPSGWILKAAPEKDISVDTHSGGGGGNTGYIGNLNSITGMGSFGYNYMGPYSAYASNPGGYAATYGTQTWMQQATATAHFWSVMNEAKNMLSGPSQVHIRGKGNEGNAGEVKNITSHMWYLGGYSSLFNSYSNINWNTATACENPMYIGVNTGSPRIGYHPDADNVLKIISTGNGLFGLGISAAQEFTLAGKGLYVTSKGLTRPINWLNLTRNSRPYAESFTIMRNFGRVSLGIGIGLDFMMWRRGQISGAKFGINTSISGWGILMGEMGGGIPALGISALYFGIDTFYPGGFNGAMNDQGNLIDAYQQIMGGTNMFYKH